jgi:hypothetical protein
LGEHVDCRLLLRFGTILGEARRRKYALAFSVEPTRKKTNGCKFCAVFSISRGVVCQNFRHCRLSIFEVASFVSNWWFKNGEST